MKKVKLCWTPFAERCLAEIDEYIKQQTNSAEIAGRYIQKLILCVEQLYYFPNSGQVEPLLRHLNQNSRYLIEGNYKIIYQFNNDKVVITDVFHTKQNPVKIAKRNIK